MEIRYPILIIIGIVLILLAIFLKRKKDKYTTGTKVANTSLVKDLPYFKKKIKFYKFLILLSKVICIISMLICTILLARPYNVEITTEEEYNRDIFLCMDVSASVDELNYELVDTLKDTVSSLKGERFGISIFNTSSVVLVPLTDDYEYVIDVLDKIKKSIEYNNDYDLTYYNTDDYFSVMNYITSGTLEGSETKGSSLIGDGLASCVYSFSKLGEEDRTRIIIFSTDNELAGTPLLTLEEAATISKKENVIVYGLGPAIVKNKAEYEKAVNITNGKYYDASSSKVKSIVNDIEKTSKSLIKKESQKKEIDTPAIPFIALLISLFILIILNKKVIS